VLPVGTHAECDGTFTNHAGRVQRFHRAVSAPGESRPGWQVLSDLLARAGGETPAASAEAVFAKLAAEGGAFGGLGYDTLGEHGAQTRSAAA
jgi:formate dehydrogenase major subunit